MVNKYIQANNFFGNKKVESDLIIIGDNISNPENIGSFLRIAGNFGAKAVYILSENLPNTSKINRVASTASKIIKPKLINIDFLSLLKSNSYKLVAVETASNSVNISDFTFEQKTALVLGSESYGISHNVLEMCDASVFINMPGIVKSMNVSHALAIAVFMYEQRKIKK
jgi:tRNA G18 (ribose-2'-O)-methylase SpoU